MLTLIIIFVCLLLNGLFSAFEMAYVTIEPERLSDLIDKEQKLKKLKHWENRPERILSMIQIGITFVGLFAAVIGGSGASDFISPFLIKKFSLSQNAAEAFSIFLVFLPLTMLNVVLGELVPKAIALRRPGKVLIFVNPLMRILENIFYPLIRFLESSTEMLLRLLKINTKLDVKPPTRIHIENLESYHQKYVLNLVGLKGKKNRDILIPWAQVNSINLKDPKQKVLEVIIKFRHTRLPVVDKGSVVGLLHTKEYLSLSEIKDISWRDIMRPILFFRSNEKVLDTFIQMQKTKNHFAIVEDMKGEPLGFITLENIIEEILGDIDDEDDDYRLARMLSTRLAPPSRKFG